MNKLLLTGALPPVKLLFRIATGLLAVLIIHRFDWIGPRRFTSEVVFRLSHYLGMTMIRVSATSLLYKNVVHEFTIACTFIDLFVFLIPFSWQTKRPIAYNLAVQTLLAGALAIFNLTRIEANLFLFAQGFPRWIYHDLVDGFSYFLVLTWAVRRPNHLVITSLPFVELPGTTASTA